MSVVLDYSNGVFAAKPTGGSLGTDPATIGDANFADVELLLHGDGTSGSTTITDSSSNAVSVTANGNAQIDTAVKKFGTGSIEFDGSGDFLRANDALSAFTNTSDVFTIEGWFNANSLGGTSSNTDDIIGINESGTGYNQLTFGPRFLRWNTTTYTLSSLSTGSWYHFATVFDGSVLKVYINGSLDVTTSSGAATNPLANCTLLIGAEADAGGGASVGNYYDGYLDELRITSTARYTSNFTPPTAAFLDTGPTLDLSSGNTFVHAPSANVAYAFSNPPASGTAIDFTLKVTGAGAYDIANASYDSVDFLTKASGDGPNGVFFKPDGTKFYISDKSSNVIRQYSLTSAWDITTASEGTSKSISSQTTDVQEVFFKSDGTKMFILGLNNNTVFEFDLSTAWDSSSASYNSVSFDVSSQETSARGLCFDPTGTKMYVSGQSSDAINQYGLSSAWDVSSASFTQSFSVTSEDTNPTGIFFTPDGTRMIISGNTGDNIYQYSLTVGFDISTASYDNVSFSVSGQMSGCQGLFLKDDGTKMYVIGFNNRLLRQYSTVAATSSTITWPSSVKWAGGTAPSAPAFGQTDAFTFYSTDGGSTYYGFHAGDAYS